MENSRAMHIKMIETKAFENDVDNLLTNRHNQYILGLQRYQFLAFGIPRGENHTETGIPKLWSFSNNQNMASHAECKQCGCRGKCKI